MTSVPPAPISARLATEWILVGNHPQAPVRGERSEDAYDSPRACSHASCPRWRPCILCFFAVVEGKGLTFAEQVKNDLGGILVKNWSVFLPATVINLGFCPPELRVLFLNCVFFGWVVYLSLFLNAEGETAE